MGVKGTGVNPSPVKTMLTPKEQKIFEFIKKALEGTQIAPSFEEIQQAFGFASINSVQQYIRQLVRKGVLAHPGGNQKRAVSLSAKVDRSSPLGSPLDEEVVRLPFVGLVAAGRPIEAIEEAEELEVPKSLLRQSGDHFALRVQGNSMVEDHICDGDVILVRKQRHAENGETAVVLVNNEATVKKFYRWPDSIELIPANSEMSPIHIKEGDCEIQGIVTGIIRKI